MNLFYTALEEPKKETAILVNVVADKAGGRQVERPLPGSRTNASTAAPALRAGKRRRPEPRDPSLRAQLHSLETSGSAGLSRSQHRYPPVQRHLVLRTLLGGMVT
jgi:hypothetical protein